MIDFLKWTLLNEHNGNNAIMIVKVISISKLWHYGLFHSEIDFTKKLRETNLVKGRTLKNCNFKDLYNSKTVILQFFQFFRAENK